jgi:hypothetical protein
VTSEPADQYPSRTKRCNCADAAPDDAPGGRQARRESGSRDRHEGPEAREACGNDECIGPSRAFHKVDDTSVSAIRRESRPNVTVQRRLWRRDRLALSALLENQVLDDAQRQLAASAFRHGLGGGGVREIARELKVSNAVAQRRLRALVSEIPSGDRHDSTASRGWDGEHFELILAILDLVGLDCATRH